jgi:hypothetical protein
MTMFSPAAERDRRRRLIRRLVLIGALLVVLVVAAAAWPKPTSGPLSVATTASADPTGVLKGTLDATRRGDHVCYSVAVGGTTSVLRFVTGWSADAHLGLRDPSGSVIAQPGDAVTVLGRPGSVGTVPGCPLSGRVWTVTSVRL